MITEIIIGILAGILSVMLGIGGGALIIPALIFLKGMSPPSAIATSALVSSATVTMSALSHLRGGTPDKRTAVKVASGGLVGVAIGDSLFFLVAPYQKIMKVLLAIFFIFISYVLIKEKIKLSLNPFVLGSMVGLISGLFGIAGGSLLTPSLALMGYDIKVAVGTSSVATLPLIYSSAIPKFLSGLADPIVAINLMIGTITGVRIGFKIFERIPKNALKYILASFLVFVAIRLLL